MKIKKYVGILSLGLGLLVPTNKVMATAPITNENYIIETTSVIDNLDKASASELKAYDDYNKKEVFSLFADSKKSDLEKLQANFGKEYELRLSLLKAIKTLEKLDPVSSKDLLEESFDILNGEDLEAIAREELRLKTHIIEKNDQLRSENKLIITDLSPSEEKDLSKATSEYLDKGTLFGYSNSDVNLEAYKTAILNSKAYYKAEDSIKEKYNSIISELAANEVDNKEAYKILEEFIDADNKMDFEIDLVDETASIENISFNASNDGVATGDESVVENTTIENSSQNSETETSSNVSAFLNNPQTSTAYNELSDPLKRELDAIDTDNNGILSAAELDNSANYTSNIESDSWLYPFTEKGLNAGDQATSENTDQASQATTENTTSPTTGETSTSEGGAQNQTQNQDRQPPQTVTIDDNTKSPQLANENEADDTDEAEESLAETPEEIEEEYDDDTWSEAVASENTEAATVVKTGIKGLGIVIAILAIALLAYYLLGKDKKKSL